MTDRPINLKAHEVRAVMAGRKTQRREIIKPQPFNSDGDYVNINISANAKYTKGHDGRYYIQFEHPGGGPLTAYISPYAVGDRLWVREAHYRTDDGDYERVVYAENEAATREHLDHIGSLKASHPAATATWVLHEKLRRSIHMPRWASRLTLIVDGVKVERLQDISEEDAIAEGVIDRGRQDGEPWGHCTIPDAGFRVSEEAEPSAVFAQLWESIHGPGAWAKNPFVAAVSFRTIKANIDALR